MPRVAKYVNAMSFYSDRLRARLRATAIICFWVSSCFWQAAGEMSGRAASTSPTVKAHFFAAQEAQKRQDYVTAEHEYKALLATAPNFAEVHMNLGLVYQLQNRINEAMTEFRHALKIKPSLPGANFFLGVDYCKLGEGIKAIPYLKASVRADPERPETWSWLATAQELAGDIQGEVVSVKRGLKRQPQNIDLLYLLGHAYERLGKEEVKDLQKTAPGSAISEQFLAESYAVSNEWPLAVIRFQNALADSPRRPGLHTELGEVFLRAGKHRQAVREFDDELQHDSHYLRAIVRRGETRLIEGDVEGSLADWATALETDPHQTEQVLGVTETGLGDAELEQLPDDLRKKIETLTPELTSRGTPAAHLALAFLAAQTGNTAEVASELNQVESALRTRLRSRMCSIGNLREAIKNGGISRVAHCAPQVLGSLPPDESRMLRIALARSLVEAGDYDASLEALDGLPSSNRHSPDAIYLRARCYEKLAAAAYLRLSRVDPNSYRVHQLMGDLYAAKGDDGKAMDEYRAAISLKPELPNLHYSLGHLLWKDLKVAEARAEFEAELALNPRHAGALDDLGNTYLLEHQPDKAMVYLKRAIAADTNDPGIHRDLGTAYSQLHEYRKAEAEFKIAVNDDHDGSVHYKLGKVYQALGEKDKAEHEFAASTALNRESHSKLERQTQRLSEIEKLSKDP
jgi:tetratricopeptide (TPR) repeat protein